MANGALVDIPEGLGTETLAAAIVLSVFASLTIVLRIWVRVTNGAIGCDDYLMIIGFITFIICCVFTHLGCLSGLGATDEVIRKLGPSGEMYKEGLKWVFYYEECYLISVPFIKTSICAALLRITSAKRYVIPLWVVMVLTVVASVIGFVAVLQQCTPIAASWDVSLGTCEGTGRSSTINIAISAVTIVTDWMCAIFPALILWNLNMQLKVKTSLVFVLALGALASVSTCVRLPYIEYYTHVEAPPPDTLHRTANIIVWSIVECGIGIIAGSLPPLRPMFRKVGLRLSESRAKWASGRHAAKGPILCSYHRHVAPPTVPEAVARPVRLGDVARVGRGNSLVTTCQGGRRSRQDWWESSSVFDDASSQKMIIVKKTQIDIQYEDARPGTGESEFGKV